MTDCAQKSGRQPVEVDFGAFKEPFRKLAQALEKIAETAVSEQARDEARKLLTEADALVERLGEVKAAAIAGRSGLEHSIHSADGIHGKFRKLSIDMSQCAPSAFAT